MSDYESLKAQCLRSKKLYEDPEFGANWSSLNVRNIASSSIVWRRPHEIAENPRFFHRGATYYDIQQGELGNCWFVAAAITLSATKRKLMDKVIPSDQEIYDGNYAGIFRFNFWQYGQWVEVIIDDRLPTRYGRLIFTANRRQENEFWAPLLEKAYAKLHGSYSSLIGGVVRDGLVDLTGGLSEPIDLKDSDVSTELIKDIVLKSNEMNTFMAGAIFNRSGLIGENRLPNGLYEGHAYAITKVDQVTAQGRVVVLLRAQNPWGKGEWNGAWSDGSAEWKYLSPEEKERFPPPDKTNGEFWISLDDFRKNFDEIELCHLSPGGVADELARDEGKKTWQAQEFRGEWVAGVSAGGPLRSYTGRMFWKNPQYRFHLDETHGNMSSAVMSLMEINKPGGKSDDVYIGFAVFKLQDGRQPDTFSADNYYEYRPRLAERSGAYTPYREVTKAYNLEPGEYLIVPNTYEAGKEAKFFLRIFTEGKTVTEPVVEPVGPTDGADNIVVVVDAFESGFTKFSTAGYIDAFGLQELLSQMKRSELSSSTGISLESSRCLLTFQDAEVTGQLDLTRARKAWDIVKICLTSFKSADHNSSGSIDIHELGAVVKATGFSVNSDVLKSMARRYQSKDGNIHEDDFIQTVCRLYSLYYAFDRKKFGDTVRMDLSEWLATALYC